MIIKLGEVFGGVSGGKRGILSSKGFLSLPLRLIPVRTLLRQYKR
jgi:hypothetical protein